MVISNAPETERLTSQEALASLSPRDIEILNYVAQGYRNKQIAAEFSIGEQTVKNRMSSILDKLNADNRTEAVIIAIQHRLISIG